MQTREQPMQPEDDTRAERPRSIDYSLYLVTDRALALDRSLVEVVQAAARGGVSCVQLREKHCSSLEFFTLAREVKAVLAPRQIPLIINDRLDVALAVGADGVHLGQQDLPLHAARAIAGSRLIIGISVESVEDALWAEQNGADYLGVSPIYTTPTKLDTAAPLGLEGLRAIRQAVRIPLVGIGGLNRDNAGDLIQAGGDGVAVVSAIVAARDPESAARELLMKIREARVGMEKAQWA